MKNLKFYFSIMFILIAMACSVALNMTYMEKPAQNMYKFILAVSTLLIYNIMDQLYAFFIRKT
jgi:hypothetical protein